MAARQGYDAFISYNHQRDRSLAARLQPLLEGFARRKTGRPLRLFRDDAVLGAGPDLTAAIRTALQDSDWFILLASPGAARSAWVDAEVAWWLAEKDPGRLLIALTDGEIVWNAKRAAVHRRATNALPPSLVDHLDAEPKFVDARPLRHIESPRADDARVADVVAQLVAPIRNVSKDELIGWQAEAVAHERRRNRAVISTLAALLAVTVAATALAGNQLAVNTSRLLGATAQETADTDAVLARLLAVEAYTRDPGADSYGALVDVMTDEQAPVSSVDIGATTGDEVVDVVGAQDGRHVVGVGAGPTAGGDVRFFRWDTEDGSVDRSETTSLPLADDYPGEHVQDLATTADGSAAAATNGNRVALWHDGEVIDARLGDSDRMVAAIGLTPDASYVAVVLIDAEGNLPGYLSRPAVLSIRSAHDLSEAARTTLPGTRVRTPGEEPYGVSGSQLDENAFMVVAGPSPGWRELTLDGSRLVLTDQSDGKDAMQLLSDDEIDHFAEEHGGDKPSSRWATQRIEGSGSYRVVSENVRAQGRIDPYSSASAVNEAQAATSQVWFDGFAYAVEVGRTKSSESEPTTGPAATPWQLAQDSSAHNGFVRLSDSGRLMLFPRADGARVVELTDRAEPYQARQWHLPMAVSAGRGDFLGSDGVVTVRDDVLTLWSLRAAQVLGPVYDSLVRDYLAQTYVGDLVPPALALDARRGTVAAVTGGRALLVLGPQSVGVQALPSDWFASLPVWLPDGRLILVRATGGLAEVDLPDLMDNKLSLQTIGDVAPASTGCDIATAAKAVSTSAVRSAAVTVARACGGRTVLSTQDGTVLDRDDDRCESFDALALDPMVEDDPQESAWDEARTDQHTWLGRIAHFGVYADGEVYSDCTLLTDTDGVALGRDVTVVVDRPEYAGSPDEQLITLWDRSLDEVVHRAEQDGESAVGIAFVPGTEYVAYPRVDTGELVIMDMETGATVTTVPVPYGASDRVVQVGSHILSYSAHGGVQAWDLRPEALVRDACASAGRDLTQQEWADVVGWVPAFDLTCGRQS